MNEQELKCPYCDNDPFLYVDVEGVKVPVAVACCEQAASDYYQSMTVSQKEAEEKANNFKMLGKDEQ
jgi:hypothetical protein